MATWLQVVLAVIGSVFASSGFWAWMQMKHDKKDAKSRLIMGLGHDRIVFLCTKYIDRGWISHEEYDDLQKYLYIPYLEMGGNGTAKRLINMVEKLPPNPPSTNQNARVSAT